jgi:hypothetical protein
VRQEGLGKLKKKKLIYPIGSRTRDLPACSIVSTHFILILWRLLVTLPLRDRGHTTACWLGFYRNGKMLSAPWLHSQDTTGAAMLVPTIKTYVDFSLQDFMKAVNGGGEWRGEGRSRKKKVYFSRLRLNYIHGWNKISLCVICCGVPPTQCLGSVGTG